MTREAYTHQFTRWLSVKAIARWVVHFQDKGIPFMVSKDE